MPTTHIALIRGINGGRAKRVAMADLRALVESLGYREVRTLLNSGNVVFTGARAEPAKAAERIEKGMVAELGVSARVIVLTAQKLADVVAENPLLKIASDPSRLLVAVFEDAANGKMLKPIAKEDWGQETLAVGKRAAYLWCPNGIAESRVVEAVNKRLGESVTARNWATMLKIQTMVKESPD